MLTRSANVACAPPLVDYRLVPDVRILTRQQRRGLGYDRALVEVLGRHPERVLAIACRNLRLLNALIREFQASEHVP